MSFVSVTQQFNTTTSMGRDLRKRGIVTKVRKLKTGESIGGVPFTRGSLAQLLRNRFYIGEVAFKGEVFKGEQPAILDRALFDDVQTRLNEQVTNHKAKWMKSESPSDRPYLRRSRQPHDPKPCPQGQREIPVLSVIRPPAGHSRTRRIGAAGDGN